MKCKEVVAKYADFEQGLLDWSHNSRIMEHISECDECRQYAEGMSRLTKALDCLSQVDPPEDIWAHVAVRINTAARSRTLAAKAPAPARRTIRRIISRPAFSATVALAIVAFAGLFGYFQNVGTDNPGYVMVPGEDAGTDFAALHVCMSVQEPLALKGAWVLAAAAEPKELVPEVVRPAIKGGAPQ